MGLDMYLEGRTFNWATGDQVEMRDGFRVKGVMLELGYWRKHPNLHGYIVATFAGGKDNCQEIELDDDAIRDIIDAVKANRLPVTTGFFFGRSDGSEDTETIAILERALAWLEDATPPTMRKAEPIAAGMAAVMIKPEDFSDARESRSVIYRASW